MSVRTEDNNSVTKDNTKILEGLLERKNEKNKEMSPQSIYDPKYVTDEKRAKSEQKIKGIVDNYHKATPLSDRVMPDNIDSSFTAMNLDKWYKQYKNGQNVYELKPLLDVAADKNISPSELMSKDANYQQLVMELSKQELIPEIGDNAQGDVSVNLDSPNIYWTNDKGNIDLSIITPNSNSNGTQPASNDKAQSNEALRAKITVDLVNKKPIDPNALDVAKKHNLPPSIIYSDDPKLKKLIEQFGSQQIDTTLNTPVTFKFMQNAAFATKTKEEVGFLQKIEEFYNSINDAVTLPKLWDETDEEHRARLQSNNTLDNLKYGMMSMGVGVLSLANMIYTYGSPVNFISRTLSDNLLGKTRKNTLFDNIVTSAARITNDMPRDFVKEDVTKLYRDGGFFVALGSLMVNYQRMANLFAQELPSVLVTRKVVPGDGLKVEYIRGFLKDYLTGSPSSIVEGVNKSNNLEHSQNKLATNAAISNLSAFLPAKTSSSIINYFADQLTSSATSALATGITDRNFSLDDVVASFIVSNMMAPLNKTVDGSYHKGIHDLSNDAQNLLMSSMARSSLAKQHPREFEIFAHEILKKTQYKTAFINAEALYKILAENNIDAHKIVKEITGDPNYLTRALLSKGNIEIPTEKLITNVVPNISDFSKLQDHFKYSQTGLTNHEKSLLARNDSEIRKMFNDKSKQNTIDLERYKVLLKKQLDKKVNQPQAEQHALATLIVSKVLNNTADIKADNIKEVNVVENNNAHHFIKLDKVKGVIELNVSKEVNLTTYLQNTTALFLNSERVLTNAENNLLIKQYLNADDIDTITLKQQSKWIKSFENYMKTGNLDDQSIKPVFDQYKKVIIQFYKENQALGANFDAEVRQTFDLLNFTEYATNYSASYQPVFGDASVAGMSSKDFEAYLQHFKETSSYVSDKVFHQRAAELNSERNKLWRSEYKKEKQTAANDAQNAPVLQLRSYLEKGIQKDGSKGVIVKLDHDMIVQRYGQDVAKQLANLTQNNGMSLESFVDTWGFKSSDEMVISLLYGPQNKKDYIAVNSEKAMQQFDYLLDRADIAKQVQQSLESDKRESILATEESLLQQKYEQSNGKTISKEAAASMVMSNDLLRATARKMVKEGVIKPSDLDDYLITMRRENTKAANASKKQDWKSALESKNAERLNFFLYHEASKEINRQNIKKKEIIHKLKQRI